MSAPAIEEIPQPAAPEAVQEIADTLQLASLSRQIDVSDDRPELAESNARPEGREWDRNVRQWDPNWVVYDEYYRPVISNPYREPVKIVYVYENQPRVVIINPLQRVVLEVAQYAAYSFTAVVANTLNTAVNTAAAVAVGSFFGGGYFPGYGAPPPPPPPPVLRYDNVPVQVRYTNATYEPFRVQRIVDVGQDTVYGARKVLLDGVTPAWGEWRQTPTGERMFEINKTQQFPGLEEPSEAPLPGDYKLRLASDESSTGMDSKTLYMIIAAGVLAAMSVGAVVWSMMLGRRRTPLA